MPGLYKIFDEIIVNAADNKQRDPSMNKIEVTIDANDNSIRVWNNGQGIPVVIHQEHNIYVPELIFGHLLTGIVRCLVNTKYSYLLRTLTFICL